MNVSQTRSNNTIRPTGGQAAPRPQANPTPSEPVDTVSITGAVPGAEAAGARLAALARNFGSAGRSVEVQSYRNRGGQEGSTLEGILRSQGHTRAQIYSGAPGQRLIDQVARANNLRNPDQIRAGQQLMVPASESRQQQDRARLDAMLPPSQYSEQAPVITPNLHPRQDDRNSDGRIDLRERLQGNAGRQRLDRERFCAENPQIPSQDCLPQGGRYR